MDNSVNMDTFATKYLNQDITFTFDLPTSNQFISRV